MHVEVRLDGETYKGISTNDNLLDVANELFESLNNTGTLQLELEDNSILLLNNTAIDRAHFLLIPDE